MGRGELRWGVLGAVLAALHCGGQEFDASSSADGGGGASTSTGAGGRSSSASTSSTAVTSSSTGGSSSASSSVTTNAGATGGGGGASGGVGGGAGAIVDAGIRDSPASDVRMDVLADTKPPDALGTSFCSMSPHTFCSDFDEADALGAWTNQALAQGGQLSLSTAQSTSHPQSLFVRTVMTDSGASSQALLHKNLTGNATSHAHVAFDLYTSQFAPSGSSNALSFTSGSTYVTLALTQGAQISCRVNPFGAGVSAAAAPCPATFPPNAWTHVDLDFNVSGQTISVKMTIAGTTSQLVFQSTSWTGAASLEIGSYPGTGQNYWEGYFDNVVVDLQ